jgi:hypothetical protein
MGISWDDVVFGVATGGLYNVGKTAYKAGEAADQAGDAIEEFADGAGAALASVGSTLTRLMRDTSSFIKELEELLAVKRITPREEDDLWDEEVDRLAKLRQRESELVAELRALDASDDESAWGDFLGDLISSGLTGISRTFDEIRIRTKLAVVRKAIEEILLEEPGVVPVCIYQFKEILERFNTMEQPRIEDILDSVDEGLEEGTQILREVKKLFVVRTWRELSAAEIPEAERLEAERLEADLARYDRLIDKHAAVAAQLQDALVRAQPGALRLDKWAGAGGEKAEGGGNPGTRETAGLAKLLPARPSFALKGKGSVMAAQTMSSSVATALNQNAVSAYRDNFQVQHARLRFCKRERLKVERAIYRIRWVAVEEPGVIPKTLEEVRQSLHRFRTETQPRVETLLDSLNGVAGEAKETIAGAGTLLQDAQSAASFLSDNARYLRIGLLTAGALGLLVMLMTFIVLVKLAFVL